MGWIPTLFVLVIVHTTFSNAIFPLLDETEAMFGNGNNWRKRHRQSDFLGMHCVIYKSGNSVLIGTGCLYPKDSLGLGNSVTKRVWTMNNNIWMSKI